MATLEIEVMMKIYRSANIKKITLLLLTVILAACGANQNTASAPTVVVPAPTMIVPTMSAPPAASVWATLLEATPFAFVLPLADAVQSPLD